MVRESTYVASSMLWVQVPLEQLFFLFYVKIVVQVSCIALFIYVRRFKTFPMLYGVGIFCMYFVHKSSL